MIQLIALTLMGLGGIYGITYHTLRTNHNDKMIQAMKKLIQYPGTLKEPKVQEYMEALIKNTQV